MKINEIFTDFFGRFSSRTKNSNTNKVNKAAKRKPVNVAPVFLPAVTISYNPIYSPQKHTVESYRSQQRAAVKRRKAK